MTWALIPPYDTQAEAVERIMTTGEERVVAVLGGALLAFAVERTLVERLHDDEDVRKSVIGMDKPLGSLRPQINMLYLLRAFDDRTRKAMRAIAKIRNEFAHTLDAALDAKKGDVAGAMAALTLHEGRTHYPHHLFGPDSEHEIEKVTNGRLRFIVNLKLSLITLMRDRLSHVSYSNVQYSEEDKQRVHGPNKERQEQARKAQSQKVPYTTTTSMLPPIKWDRSL